MVGTGHPLTAHLVGTFAVEELGSGFRLRLGLKHGLLCPWADVLSADG